MIYEQALLDDFFVRITVRAFTGRRACVSTYQHGAVDIHVIELQRREAIAQRIHAMTQRIMGPANAGQCALAAVTAICVVFATGSTITTCRDVFSFSAALPYL